jgi:hypothetical protein
MATKRITPEDFDLTPSAIELLRSLAAASTTGIQAIALVPSALGDEYDLLIEANLIEVRNVVSYDGRFRGQASPHVLILPAGIQWLRKLDGIEPRK